MSNDDNGKRAVLHASVPESLARELKAVAVSEDRSLSGQLRVAVAEHIARHEEARTT